jgi:ABC-type transporter Mla subunit MlaD
MAENTTPGLGDLFGLLGGNPLAGATKSLGQFQRTVTDLVQALERLDQTVTRLDTATQRLADSLERAASVTEPSSPTAKLAAKPRRKRTAPPPPSR